MAVTTRRHALPDGKNKHRRARARGVSEATERVRRADDDPLLHRLPLRSEAADPCGQGMPCGPEAACLTGDRVGTYTCVCPHDRQPPTADLKCPNRNTVPLALIPIRNVIPPRPAPALAASDPPPAAHVVSESAPPAGASGAAAAGPGGVDAGAVAAAGAGAVLLVAVALALAACLVRRRAVCLHKGKTPQRTRPGEPLIAERYITNPQYGVWGGAGGGGGGPGSSVPASGPAPRIDCAGLTFLEEVGEGCFGKVHKGLLRQGGVERVVAVKVLKESAGRNAEEDFLKEVTIMSAFRHDNILALLGVVYRDEVSAPPWMVFEYMEWGDLARVLRGPARRLSAAALLRAALHVARGMAYLAARRFVHRDLAARNCLVGADLCVKIADFGMSRDVYTCDYYKMGGERPMPVRWMSPESIVYARFTLESDVWAYGVVLWEIFSRGKQPYYGHNNEGATKLILQGIMLVPPADCPRVVCHLMRACWRSDPRDRLRFPDICAKLEAAERAPLPRPPAAPALAGAALDTEGYLVPAAPPLAAYLQPLPDRTGDQADSSDEDST